MTTLDNVWRQFKEKKHTVGLKQANWKLEHLIAEEEHELKRGMSHSISIKNIKLPANHVAFLPAYLSHRYGNIIAVGEAEPRPMDMERRIEYARFSTGQEGTIRKGDFLGYVLIVPIEKKLVK